MKAKLKALVILLAGVGLLAVAVLVLSGGMKIMAIDSSALDASAQGKLVYTNGMASSATPLEDKLFGVSEPVTFGLRRVVEMYQWQEKPEGGYEAVWSEPLIDDSVFADKTHQNPKQKPVATNQQEAQDVTLGAYTLSARLRSQISAESWESLPFTAEQYSALPAAGKRAFKLHEGKLFYGIDPMNPRIGDMRIRFEKAPPMTVSVVAELSGNELVPDTQTGNSIGKAMNGALQQEVLLEGMDMPGGTLRLGVAGVGLVVTLIGVVMLRGGKGSSSKKSKGKEEHHDDEFLGMDDGFEMPAEPASKGGKVNDNLAAAAAGIVAGSAMAAHEPDGEFGALAPMKTPGMEEKTSVPDELAPSYTVSQPHPTAYAPAAHDQFAQPEFGQQPAEDQQFMEMDFAPSPSGAAVEIDEHDGFSEEIGHHAMETAEVHFAETETTTSLEYNLHAMERPQGFVDDFDTGPAPESYAPTHEDIHEEQIGDGMFMLDSEQTEDASHPTEVAPSENVNKAYSAEISTPVAQPITADDAQTTLDAELAFNDAVDDHHAFEGDAFIDTQEDAFFLLDEEVNTDAQSDESTAFVETISLNETEQMPDESFAVPAEEVERIPAFQTESPQPPLQQPQPVESGDAGGGESDDWALLGEEWDDDAPVDSHATVPEEGHPKKDSDIQEF